MQIDDAGRSWLAGTPSSTTRVLASATQAGSSTRCTRIQVSSCETARAHNRKTENAFTCFRR
eukprot:2608574-Rhodomonas_salina.2